ncbi:response regulator [Roseivivax sp. THAF30]|uniref:response regulator n=1 Tax=Roseivivax sp. THAF30 TaxID=2587852 RepID=UPI001268B915|nr:response regulator [Roseivivax sp. THAF30]QFT64821.1 Transcriptional regulatory protein CitB [Roseivivax sp. THAF30]
MTESEFLTQPLKPSAARPLLGLTILLVEDSLYACDAIRLLCLRSGARLRRADCLMSARRHLEVYRPSAILIDMGLPDGSGADLIRELAAATPKVPAILAISGDPFAEHVAIAAGADGFFAKPLTSLGAFQSAILAHLPPEQRPEGPRLVREEPVRPDPISLRDDIMNAAAILENSDAPERLDYAARFLCGVAMSAGDRALADAAGDLFEARVSGLPYGPCLARVSGLLQERMSEPLAV